MNTKELTELEDAVIQTIRAKTFKAKKKLIAEINQEIEKTKQRERESTDEATKEFHRGVHGGLTHALLLISRWNICHVSMKHL